MNINYTFLHASVAMIAILAPLPAFSQATEQDPAAAETGTGGFEEIIVTARRTDENLQDVPVAASVVSAGELSRRNVTSTRDLQFNAPSLVITPDPLGGSSTPIVQLRGQTSPLGTDNTVVTYFADVPVDARVVAAGIFDLASVQVIRGPQGTLFGKNSTGGALLFSPQKATADRVKGFGEVILGDYSLRQLTGAINLPLIEDTLAIRVSGQITDQRGYADNIAGPDGNDKHWQAGRTMISFTPEGNFTNDTVFTYFNGRQRQNPNILRGISGFATFIPAVVDALALQEQLGPRRFSMSEAIAPNIDDNESYLIGNTSTLEIGSMTLKNTIGYSNTQMYIRQNQPAIEFNYIDVAQDRSLDQISDELQLSGKSFGEALSWIVGGFYSKQTNKVDQSSRIFSPVPNTLSNSIEKYTSKALFAQGTFDFTDVGLDGIKFTAGVRHSWDKRVGSNEQNVPIPLTTKDDNWSWTLGLDYQVSDDLLLYVASRHSYKAGGFNLISPLLPPPSLVYEPEKLTDIEIGAKLDSRVGSVPVRSSVALYRGWYKNIHTQVTGFCGGATGQTSLIINAGKGSPKGLEFEAEARLTPNLRVSGFYNRTLGKYDQFVVPTVSGCTISAVPDISGQNFGNISKDTAGLNATYSIPVGDNGGELELNGNMYYRSKRLGNDLLGFMSPMPGYTIFNARVDLRNIGGSRLSLGVYVQNLTDKTYGISRNVALGAGYDVWQFGDPRTFGVVGKIEL